MSTMRQPVLSPSASRQHGGVLVVATVLLFVMSMLGVASMRGSTMEQRMASNAVHASTVFQAAESVTEATLNDAAQLGAAYELGGETLDASIDLKLGSGVSVDGTLRYVGDGAALEYSLGEGSGNFMSLRYEARGNAALTAARSYSSVTQGASRVVPAP